MARVLQEAVLDTTVELFVAQFNHNRYTSNGGSYLKPKHTENIIKSLRRADASRVDVNIRIDETGEKTTIIIIIIGADLNRRVPSYNPRRVSRFGVRRRS